MRILYKQASSDILLKTLGIKGFYLKNLSSQSDSKVTFYKEHHHTGFEIHLMNKGQQKYVIDEKEYVLSCGNFLLIPPLKRHCVADANSYSSKFSMMFKVDPSSPFAALNKTVFCKMSDRITNAFNNITRESKIASAYSEQIISGCIFEVLIVMLRLCGYNERKRSVEKSYEDDRLTIAKQYIRDNIQFNIKVTDVAAHCCLGTKQLTRLFNHYENLTPLAYIHKQKIEHIDSFLLNGYLLKEISEIMNFSSEYHLNSFYKKITGISPGKFKKTIPK
jgi:AraC-like DNA-binding protein